MSEAHAGQTAPARPDLGAIRTALAAERTLMAWVRTSLGLISFGFTLHKVIHALGAAREASPRRMGIVLAAMGTLALAAGTIQYLNVFRSLQGRRLGFTFYMSCAVIGLGVLVLIGLVARIGPFS